jgi:2-polyprenyl-3-methyl-5-hydroxy-6-metoxy-1,4-benzoquinol methylase
MTEVRSFETKTAGDQTALTQAERVRLSFAAAEEYAHLYEGSTPHSRFFNERLRLVLERLGSVGSGKLLDVGCGPGMLLHRLAGGPLDIFGIDQSPDMIAEARARTLGQANVMVGRLEHLPYQDQSFDVVVGLGVLEYLPEQGRALAELARVAKPNSLVILSMVNKLSLYRCWERSVDKPLHELLTRMHGDSVFPEPAMRLHSGASLTRLMKDCRLDPIELVYYDLNICLTPLDAKYPKQAVALNEWLKLHCLPWLFPLMHTAFLVTARKRG